MKKLNPLDHAGIIGAVGTILVLGVLGLFVGMDQLRSWVEASGLYAPLAFIALKASTVIIAPLSGGPVYPLVGALFGYWPGILYTIIGDFIGYAGAFWIARAFGRTYVEKLISDDERGLLARVMRHMGTLKGLVHACFTFFAMPEIICYGAGLSRMKFWKFMLVLMPLGLVASSVLVFAGALLGDQTLLVSIMLPVFGLFVILAGGWLFFLGVRDKR